MLLNKKNKNHLIAEVDWKNLRATMIEGGQSSLQVITRKRVKMCPRIVQASLTGS